MYLSIAIKLLVGMLGVIFFLRISGKTQMAQLTPLDSVNSFVLGALVGGVIYNPDTPVWYLVFAFAVWTAANVSLRYLMRFHRIRRAIKGDSVMLVRDRRLVMREFRRNGLEMEQFRTMLRENGIFSMFDVDDVRFETNGRITISRRNEPPESYLLVNGGKVMEDALERSGKGKRPEGYVEPPKEELAKLRKVSESPEDQYRREQAALAAALDEFMAEHQEAAAHPDHSNPSRRRRGDRGKNAERAERALEAEVEKEKEKQQHRRSRHHRSSRSQPLQGQTDPHSLAALAEEVMEQEEGAAPSRRRSSRSRGRSKPSGARQEKPNREAPSAKPGEGGEKKSRSRWHRRGHRRSGGQGSGSQTPPPQN